MGGHDEVALDLILRGADVDAENDDGWTALHMAARRGKLAVVKLLIRAVAHPTAKISSGVQSPLHLAAEGGHADVVTQLLAYGADLGARDSSGRTALHVAVHNRKGAAVDALLQAGTSVESSTNNDSTPLHYAARRSFSGGVGVLVHAGANIECRNSAGQTPLHLACKKPCASTVGALLQLGADENAVDDGGRTPHDTVPGERGCQSAAKGVRELLACAPALRAWRRRGWLAVLRARERVGEDVTGNSNNNHVNDGRGKKGGKSRCTGRRGKGQAADEHGGPGRQEEVDRALGGAIKQLIGIKQEEVFRMVLRFL